MEELRKQIEKSYYWDARIKELNCNYFGDEGAFVFEGDKNEITYHFEECYKIKIEHAVDLLKKIPSRELTRAQIPYFVQDVQLNKIIINKKMFMEFKINIFPIELYIVCNKFRIY